MSQTDNEEVLDEENSLEEGINEPKEPKARQVPPECKESVSYTHLTLPTNREV